MNNLKEIRKKRKLTQLQLAEFLHVDQTSISKWEQGKAIPDIKLFITLSDFYGVSIDYLLGHEIYNKKAGEFYQLTEEQKELIPLIKKLDMLNCSRVKGYLENITNENSSEEKKLI